MTDNIQVAVIGGGPAGLGAAIAAAAAGARVVLLDENTHMGGQLRYRLAEFARPDGTAILPPRLAAELTAEAVAQGVDIRGGHRVWGLFAGKEIGVERNGISSTIRAERIVLANGSIDRSLPFPGGSLPGVFTGRAVQILLNVHFVLPGRRFAIIADEPFATELKREIVLAGGEVVVTIGVAANDHSACGPDGVTSIVTQGFEREVDVVVVAAGRLADSGLALMAECAAGYSAEFEGFVPKVDANMESSIAGIYVAGDSAGPCIPEIALVEGQYAGTCVAASLGLVSNADLGAARARYLAIASDRARALSAVEGDFVQVDRVPMGVGD